VYYIYVCVRDIIFFILILIFFLKFGGLCRWEYIDKDLMYLPGDLNYTQDHDDP
jgi:hypothetical protein